MDMFLTVSFIQDFLEQRVGMRLLSGRRLLPNRMLKSRQFIGGAHSRRSARRRSGTSSRNVHRLASFVLASFASAIPRGFSTRAVSPRGLSTCGACGVVSLHGLFNQPRTLCTPVQCLQMNKPKNKPNKLKNNLNKSKIKVP